MSPFKIVILGEKNLFRPMTTGGLLSVGKKLGLAYHCHMLFLCYLKKVMTQMPRK